MLITNPLFPSRPKVRPDLLPLASISLAILRQARTTQSSHRLLLLVPTTRPRRCRTRRRGMTASIALAPGRRRRRRSGRWGLAATGGIGIVRDGRAAEDAVRLRRPPLAARGGCVRRALGVVVEAGNDVARGSVLDVLGFFLEDLSLEFGLLVVERRSVGRDDDGTETMEMLHSGGNSQVLALPNVSSPAVL